MSCWRFVLRRKLLPYIEGLLGTRDVMRLERHLLDCEPCREMLVRLRAGHNLVRRLAPVRSTDSRQPSFADLMRAQSEMASTRTRRFLTGWDWSDRLATPRVVTALAALVLLQTVVLVVSNRGLVFGERTTASAKPSGLELSQFRKLSISELKFNSQPHVATEGYVEGVHTDKEEGTVAFRLVESRGGSQPFVVCEIAGPIQMEAPREGSHVRVYGVARYDAQADRKWYEVNPVFHIDTLGH
ncbi:MAG TPA: zf-HC2 domain-containing protein [Terriglobia bacterium]|nr:zf-HC2 domain-containing protein [Terriglobia bacterium]